MFPTEHLIPVNSLSDCGELKTMLDQLLTMFLLTVNFLSDCGQLKAMLCQLLTIYLISFTTFPTAVNQTSDNRHLLFIYWMTATLASDVISTP